MFSACCSARSVLSSELLLSKHVVIFGNVFFNTTTARASATSTADASSSERESSQDQGGAKLEYSNGHVKLTLTLPSRRERCAFTLRPVNDTVKHFIDYLKVEDKSVEKVTLYSSGKFNYIHSRKTIYKVHFNNRCIIIVYLLKKDGVRIAQHTPIGSLVTRPFTIRIDDASVSIQPPKSAAHSEELQRDSDLNELRNLVAKLYTQLNVGEHEAAREHEIAKRLEVLRCELEPLERERHELTLKAKKHTNRMVWLGMGLMGVQVGIMARLTYFDYSWDIVEPISYFVSYAAVMGAASYYVLTRKVSYKFVLYIYKLFD